MNINLVIITPGHGDITTQRHICHGRVRLPGDEVRRISCRRRRHLAAQRRSRRGRVFDAVDDDLNGCDDEEVSQRSCNDDEAS